VWGPTESDWGGTLGASPCLHPVDPLQLDALGPEVPLVDRIHLLLERHETSYNLLLGEVEKLVPSQGKLARLPHSLVGPCQEILCDLAGMTIQFL